MGSWRPRAALVALAAALVIFTVGLMPSWQDLRGRAFDIASTTAPPLPDRPGVVIVAIDEPSFDAFGEDWPWSRERHARLVEALREAGAKAIGFDIVFADPSDPDADAAFAASIGTDVVLAGSEQIISRDYGETLVETLPLPELTDAGAAVGIAVVSGDSDGVVRRMPAAGGLAEALLLASGQGPAAQGGDRLIQYFGGPATYPTVSYYQALEPDIYLPPGYFEGETVLVGLALQTSIASEEGGVDAFETPFTLETGLLTPGVEVQATIFDNLRQGLAVRVAPGWLIPLMIVLGALAAWLISFPRAAWKRGLAFIGGLVALAAGSWLLLKTGRVWLPPVDPMASFGLAFLGIGARDFALEQRRRKEVQGAFSRYISPTMVDRLVKDPSLLKLGGEKKELTVLFADIRGFTTISEALKDDPEGLVNIINDILDPLSDIVIKYGGTIDKYMGDCIMAFWGAPLDDPQHRQHAVMAGKEMVEALPAINEAIADRLPPGAEIRIGVGLNTGTCVVGNMGSSTRFDYSILGDTVNAASRLEGQSKELGVPIVIGESVIEGLEGFAFRPVDRITLRGKTQAMEVFTLEGLQT